MLFLLGLVMVGFLVVVWGLGRPDEEPVPPVEPAPFQQDRGDDRDRDRPPPPRRGPGQEAAGAVQRGVG